MDIKEIDQMPEFQHDIDAFTWERLPEDQHSLAETISKLRQEVRWVGEKTIIAHNLAIQTAQKIQRVLIFVGITFGGWGIVEVAKALLHRP